MDTIVQCMRATTNEDKDKYMMETLNIVLKGDEKQLADKRCMKRSMQISINLADTFLAMIAMRLPLPRKTQKHRVENLYKCPMDDTTANAIRARDSAGPLTMYVSKLVLTSDKGCLYTFSREFKWHHRIGTKGQDPWSALHGRSDGVVLKGRCRHTAHSEERLWMRPFRRFRKHQ